MCSCATMQISAPITFSSNLSQNDALLIKEKRVWNIFWIKQKLSPEISRLLPFLHIITGSDTTSSLFGIGKGMALKKLTSDPNFSDAKLKCLRERQQRKKLSEQERKHLLICTSGLKVWIRFMNLLRCRKFWHKVMTCTTFVEVHILTLTSVPASYHSRCIYFCKCSSGLLMVRI